MFKRNPVTAVLITFLFGASMKLCAAQHPELGDVDWLRDYDTAQEEAKATGKPLLILFQEVPGCAGCVHYGQETLRHPVIVEVIEQHFVPLAIFNNRGGQDREILERFKEPAWNFQVMRFVSSNGADIIPREDRVWTVEGTAARMAEALAAYGRAVPGSLVELEGPEPEAVRSERYEEAAFSMYCFWDGEAKLGGIDGVVLTEAGWLDGREVVRLRFDPAVVGWLDLVKRARDSGCAQHVYAPDSTALAAMPRTIQGRTQVFDPGAYRKARDSDQKRHLRNSKLKVLELTPFQRTKVNAALSRGDERAIARLLDSDQLAQLAELESIAPRAL